MIRKLLLIAVIVSPLMGQQIQYVKRNIAKLTAPEMHGRGYVSNGDHIAAKFLKAQMDSLGLQKFGNGFGQEFSFAINTFPGAMEFKLNGQELKTGADYIIQPFSGSAQGTYRVLFLDTTILDQPKKITKLLEPGALEGKVIVLDAQKAEKSHRKNEYLSLQYVLSSLCPIILLNNEKLTWSLSMQATKFPVLQCKDVAVGKKDLVDLHIENQMIPSYTSENLIGYVPGTEFKDSFIVFSAHYDHLGRMGRDVYIPGANDNASGTSMLLDLAAYYVQNPAKYSVVFIAFAAEEVGLIGSKFYTENPLFPLSAIKFLVNVDIMGTGDEGITVVNGAVHKEAFQTLLDINQKEQLLKDIKRRGKAQNSDHYYFSEKGVPAFFIYTRGGISAYHDIFDRAETLPLTAYENCFKLINHFIRSF